MLLVLSAVVKSVIMHSGIHSTIEQVRMFFVCIACELRYLFVQTFGNQRVVERGGEGRGRLFSRYLPGVHRYVSVCIACECII